MVVQLRPDGQDDVLRDVLAPALAEACAMVEIGPGRWRSGHHELRLVVERRSLLLRRRGAVTAYAIRWWVDDAQNLRASVTGRPAARVLADIERADDLAGGRVLRAQVRVGQFIGGSKRLSQPLSQRLGLDEES